MKRMDCPLIQYNNLLENYNLVKIINEDPYRQAKVYKNNLTNQYLAVLNLQSEISLFDIQQIKQFQDVSEYILNFIDWTENYNSHKNAKGGIFLYYEYVPQNLERFLIFNQQKRLISLQLEKNIPFEEQYIWYVLISLTNTLSSLQKIKRSHMNLRPRSVLIHDDGSIKLAPLGLFPFDLNAHQRWMIMNEQTYLAPEYLKRGIQYIDWMRNDIFAAGLTVLDVMTLSDSIHLYQKIGSFQDKIRDKIFNLSPFYSQKLISIIKKMLSPNIVTIQDLIKDINQKYQQFKFSNVACIEKKKKSSLKVRRKLNMNTEKINKILKNIPIDIYSNKIDQKQILGQKLLKKPTITVNGKSPVSSKECSMQVSNVKQITMPRIFNAESNIFSSEQNNNMLTPISNSNFYFQSTAGLIKNLNLGRNIFAQKNNSFN